MRTGIIIVTVICIGLIIALVVVTSKRDTPKFDHRLLIGDWKEVSENEQLTLNEDSTFAVYIGGSGQAFEGVWQTKDLYFDNDTTSLLVLKNMFEKKYDREDYFQYYFFQINELSSDTMKLTDLSGALRKNRVNTFERSFKR